MVATRLAKVGGVGGVRGAGSSGSTHTFTYGSYCSKRTVSWKVRMGPLMRQRCVRRLLGDATVTSNAGCEVVERRPPPPLPLPLPHRPPAAITSPPRGTASGEDSPLQRGATARPWMNRSLLTPPRCCPSVCTCRLWLAHRRRRRRRLPGHLSSSALRRVGISEEETQRGVTPEDSPPASFACSPAESAVREQLSSLG